MRINNISKNIAQANTPGKKCGGMIKGKNSERFKGLLIY